MATAVENAKKRTLLESSWASHVSTKRTRKPATPETIAAQVRKSLSDNFKGFSPEQIDGLRKGDDLLTLRERLTKDKTDDVSTGMKYYDNMRQMYSESGYTATAAELHADEGLGICPRLLQALAAALEKQPRRTQIANWMGSVEKCNQAEYVGLCRWVLKLVPSVSADSLHCGKEFLRMVQRLKLSTAYAKETKLMTTKMSEILVQVWPLVPGQGMRMCPDVSDSGRMLALVGLSCVTHVPGVLL